eukprot:PhM_4_TR16474/c0_g1_i1/m.11231
MLRRFHSVPLSSSARPVAFAHLLMYELRWVTSGNKEGGNEQKGTETRQEAASTTESALPNKNEDTTLNRQQDTENMREQLKDLQHKLDAAKSELGKDDGAGVDETVKEGSDTTTIPRTPPSAASSRETVQHIVDSFSNFMGSISTFTLYAIGCGVTIVIVWYYTSARRRALARQLEREALVCTEAMTALRKSLASLEEKWTKDVTSREEQVRALCDQNAEQTKAIDQLTGALKSCAPRAVDMATTDGAESH